MTSHVRHRRISSPSVAFPVPLEPGELALNTANRQIAAGDANAGSPGVPLPMIAVRFWDARAQYAVGDFVVYAGAIRVANVAVTPGPFVPEQWTNMVDAVSAIAYVDAGDAALAADIAAGDATLQANIDGKVSKTGDSMSGPLTLPGAPVAANHAANKAYVDAHTSSTDFASGAEVAGGVAATKAISPATLRDEQVRQLQIPAPDFAGPIAVDEGPFPNRLVKTGADGKVDPSLLPAAAAAAASTVSFTPTGNVAATNVQDAIAEIDTEYRAALTNIGARNRVRVATTGSITIATQLNVGDIIDGITLAAGDLVLVKDQGAPAANGVYIAGPTPARSPDYDSYNEHPASLIVVSEGVVNNDAIFQCTSNTGGVLNTTPIIWTKLFLTTNPARSIIGGGLATGGGDLTADRVITVSESSSAQAIAGVDAATAMTPRRTAEAIAAQVPASGVHSMQVFTASATVTIPAGVRSCIWELWGASGGSGGALANTSGEANSAPGAAGAYARKALSGLLGGNTLALTVGAAGTPGTGAPTGGGNGGDTKVASGTQVLAATVTAGGGKGGLGAANSNAPDTALGGVASNGDENHNANNGVGIPPKYIGGTGAYGASTGGVYAIGPGFPGVTQLPGNAGKSGYAIVTWFK